MLKTNAGRFFEDYTIGDVIHHAVPRTVSGGERALYHALYPARHALYSSDEFARDSGLPASPIDDLAAFHVVFGKSVPDISLNAVANLGYAEGRWFLPIYAGPVMEYVRWVMVRKRDADAPAPETVVPELKASLSASDLTIPKGLDFSNYDFTLAGETHRWGDYEVGEQIDHVDGVTIEEAEHMIATRLWQNTAKVHFDATNREDGRRLIYGGHVISMARALSFNGLANAQMIVGLNAGAHANPCFSGDTVRAWSEVLEKAETDAPGVGAIRLRLVAYKGGTPFELKDEKGKYMPDVLLDLDYWAVMPK